MNGIHVTQKILALGLCAALSACRSEAGAPAIVTQPVSALVDIGSAVTLSVAAQGDAPLHYQWQANGVAIAGATEPTYAVAAAAMTDAAIYTVKVTNDRGRATSDPAALKVRQHLAADTATTYLTTSQLAINSLVASIAAQADVVAAQISGPAMTFALGQDRVLRFLSPAEQFADSRSVIELTSGDGTRLWDVSFAWHSRLGSALNRISEADEAGAVTTDSAALVSSGVDAPGVITAGTTALSYQLQNAAALDPAASLISLATSLGSQDVTAMFVIDGATNTIALQPASLSALVAAVRGAGAAALTFSLSTTDYAQTYGFEHVLSYANAQLDVTVVNADGSAATDLAGAQFVASGFNTGLHAIATADAQGHLAFTALRGDSYAVQQVLLDPGTPLVGFAALATSTASAALTLTKLAPAALANNRIAARATTSSPAAAGPRAEREARAAARPRSPLVRPMDTGSAPAYTLTATASAESELIASDVSYMIPKGTARVGLHVDVFTEEFPVYTGQQSIYNDLWLFNLELPGAPTFAQTGKVNQTHATQGTVSYDRCIDVSAATKETAVPLTGELGAENVSDDLLPTSVTLSVALDCGTKINITEFTGEASNDDEDLLYPRTFAQSEKIPDGNVSGQYLSIPLSAELPASFGIPATLKFEPGDATITSVELFLRTAGGDVSLGQSYLDQATTEAGVLSFDGLLLAPTAVTPTSARVELVAVLHGTIAGQPADSSPFPLTIDGQYTNFTSLYLTLELPGYNPNNRFGTHNESGGDSWGTLATDTWLMSSGLRYNDVSAALVAQDPDTHHSVLGHAGHSDGQQADIRYWDGNGGFTDTLGGANSGAGISALATAALTEVNTAANPHPKLDTLVAWITQNRTNIASFAALPATRRIYVGNSFIAKLLIDGVFPGTKTGVPGVTAWAHPAAVLPIAKHLDHWHISSFRP